MFIQSLWLQVTLKNEKLILKMISAACLKNNNNNNNNKGEKH